MSADQIVVTIGGLIAIVGTLYFFFFSTKKRTAVELGNEGVQEVQVNVKGGYTPDVIVVKQGLPVRLLFYRDETAACSDRVILGDFGISSPLPAFKTTPVTFTPNRAGEYTFECGMGMLRGKLIVESG